MAGALALAVLVAVGCFALLRWRGRPVQRAASRPLPPPPRSVADAGRFVVTVTSAKGVAQVVYRGDSGALARDHFTTSAANPALRVSCDMDGERRGFSDYGATR